MYDFSNICFITHVRFDTIERIHNLITRADYYNKYCSNLQTIYCEDSYEPQLLKHIKLTENDQYAYRCNKDEWNKCISHNIGAKLSKRPIYCFIDIDAIIHPEAILETTKQLNNNSKIGLMYPYNGLFLCISPEIKRKLGHELDYNLLESIQPKSTQINFQTKDVLVGHNNSVGGCVMSRRDNFFKYNGYNPNFKGWGYEDNEIPKRVHILGYDVTRLNDKYPLWHMPHEGKGQGKKAENPYYEDNRKLCVKVETSTKEYLQEYIKSWEI